MKLRFLFVFAILFAPRCFSQTQFSVNYTFKPFVVSGSNNIKALSGGGFITTTSAVDTGAAKADICVFSKFDKTGKKVWAKYFFDLIGSTVDIIEVKGGFLFTGFSKSADAQLVKIDTAGNFLWKKLYQYPGAHVFSLHPVSSSELLIYGVAEKEKGKQYNILIKVDTAGTLKWSKEYNFASPTLTKALSLSDSTVMIATGDHALRIDKDGNILWEFSVQGTELYSHAALATNNGIIFSSSQNGAPNFIFKTDNNGKILWISKKFNSDIENLYLLKDHLLVSGRYKDPSDSQYYHAVMEFSAKGKLVRQSLFNKSTDLLSGRVATLKDTSLFCLSTYNNRLNLNKFYNSEVISCSTTHLKALKETGVFTLTPASTEPLSLSMLQTNSNISGLDFPLVPDTLCFEYVYFTPPDVVLHACEKTVDVNFRILTPMDSLNVFKIELSDSTGDFGTHYTLGYTTNQKTHQLHYALPKDLKVGDEYRLRILSSAPAKVGFDNGEDLEIKPNRTLPFPDIEKKMNVAPFKLTEDTVYKVLFKGEGVSDSLYDPLKTELGKHKINYYYYTEDSCYRTGQFYVTIVSDCPTYNSFFQTDLYPNPSNGLVNICSNSEIVSMLKTQLTTVSIYDMRGDLILRESNTAKIIRGELLDVRGLSDGLYFLEVSSATKSVSRKFLIRNTF